MQLLIESLERMKEESKKATLLLGKQLASLLNEDPVQQSCSAEPRLQRGLSYTEVHNQKSKQLHGILSRRPPVIV
ncbi:hypothetical protein L195_g055436 [Trifolium pratense]|uniref:Uncharacterized protein n=1 Tax=Trifolium pratense TaxID=57577 RepID=A0A2K3KLG2_TRIPR|nr:hypothetical protein L195_g055436 [Trifolium pratense]